MFHEIIIKETSLTLRAIDNCYINIFINDEKKEKIENIFPDCTYFKDELPNLKYYF